MVVRGILILLILLLHLSTGVAQSYKTAFKNMEKGSYEKAEGSLLRSLEKDSLNPAIKYVYSLLFTTNGFNRYNLDSSYYFINAAIHDLLLVDPKELSRLEKAEILESTLQNQKTKIQQLAFEASLSINSIDGYNDFMQKFSGALQVDSAIKLRNEVAFNKARLIHTYQAYHNFMDTYPQALQVPEVREFYDRLLFQDKTKDQDLESYISFLRSNPNTPYRSEAEKNIFELKTADHQIESYLWFLRKYPQSIYVKKASDFLFHVYKEKDPAYNFLKAYAEINFSDSLSKVIALESQALIPFLEGNKFGFMNLSGEWVLPPAFERLPQKYLCRATLDDMITLGGTGARILLGKNGEVIYPSDFQSVKDLGYGLLKLKTQGRYLLLHKSGQMLASKLFEDIGLLHGTLVKVKSRTKWGIITVTDHEILPADYDDIYELGPFIVVERGETLAVTNTQTLLTNLGQNQPMLNFIFEELESIDDQYMLALEGNREAIINLDLEEMIPLKEQQIIDLRNHWVVQSDLKFFLLNKQFELLEDEIDWIQYDNSWLALKKKDKWTLMYQDNSFNPSYRFDSLKLISEEYIYLSTKDSSYVSFANRNTLKLSGSENIRLIKTREENSLSDYLLTINKNGTKRLYNHLGKKVLAGKFEQVTPINDQVFIIEEKSKKGLSNSIGRNVLPIKYDAIGEYFGGNISILRGGKFGIYNHIKRLTIEPSYDRPLKPYDKQLLTASKKGKLGVIDLKNKVVLPFVYQQIIHWNDSLALVQQSGEWGLISIDDETVYHNIIKYKMVIDNEDGKIMIYETEKGVGLISSSKGIIIAPTYNDISVLQTPSDPIFLAEKFIPEAEFYIAIYYDVRGEIIRKQAFTAAEYAKVSCK